MVEIDAAPVYTIYASANLEIVGELRALTSALLFSIRHSVRIEFACIDHRQVRSTLNSRFGDQAQKLVAQLKTPLANTRHCDPTANAQKEVVEWRRMRGADTSEWDIEEMCDGQLFVRWPNGDKLRIRVPKRKIGLNAIHPPTKKLARPRAERNSVLIDSQAPLCHEYEWRPSPPNEDAASVRDSFGRS
jgi:hypothetical protein